MSTDHARARLAAGAALAVVALLLTSCTSSSSPRSADASSRPAPAAGHPGSAEPPAPGPVGRGAYAHLAALARIGEAHGTRVSGEAGFEESSDYVVSRLERAGYAPTRQSFDFPYFHQLGPTTLELTSPERVAYDEGTDFALASYSGDGEAAGRVTGVDLRLTGPGASTSGCQATDFADVPPGRIALLQRGGCTFGEKVAHAEDAGAVGAIVLNQGDTTGGDRQDLFIADLRAPVGIPVVTVSFPTGRELAASHPEARIKTDTVSEVRTTWNVLAETEAGDPHNVVMAGAHLDSVDSGPGVNDNASGSAALLEVAEELAEADRGPVNRLRFAWWGGEEMKALGSRHYVNDLLAHDPAAFQDIALYLNADMVASPNYVLAVYDGDHSAFPLGRGVLPAPAGSAAIEEAFTRFFDDYGTGSVETPFTANSDHVPFAWQDVPSGGVFTGIEELKTEEQAARFGGTPGEPYDPCYHTDCDDLGNISRDALAASTAALAAVVREFARSTRAVNGDTTGHQPPDGVKGREDRARLEPNYRGHPE